MSDETYEILRANEAAKLMWLCDSCLERVTKPVEGNASLASIEKERDVKLDKIGLQLEALLNKIGLLEAVIGKKADKEEVAALQSSYAECSRKSAGWKSL